MTCSTGSSTGTSSASASTHSIVAATTLVLVWAGALTGCEPEPEPEPEKREAPAPAEPEQPTQVWTARAVFPGPTKTEVKPVDTPVGRLDYHMRSYEDSTAAFILAWADYPSGMNKVTSFDDLLDGAVEGALAAAGLELVSCQAATLRGFSGREIKARDRLDRHFTAKFFLAENRLFQCIVVCTEEQLETAEVRNFLASFELIASPR